MSSHYFRIVTVACFTVMLHAGIAGAQPPVPTTTSPLDSIVAVVEIRPVETISLDMQETARLNADADARITAATALQVRADTEIKVKQAQIKTIQAEIDQAKKDKRGLEQRDFETRKKLAELERSLLQSRKTLRDREIAYWEASREYFEIRRKGFESELELATKRQAVAAVGQQGTSPAVYDQVTKLQHELQDLERRTLDAEITAAEKRNKVAKQEVEMSKARKKMFDAQLKLKVGG